MSFLVCLVLFVVLYCLCFVGCLVLGGSGVGLLFGCGWVCYGVVLVCGVVSCREVGGGSCSFFGFCGY